MNKPIEWSSTQIHCAAVIVSVLKANQIPLSHREYSDAKRKEIEQAVDKAYPFPERRFKRYKTWQKEVDRLLTTCGIRDQQPVIRRAKVLPKAVEIINHRTGSHVQLSFL